MTNQMAAEHMRSHHAVLSHRLHQLIRDLQATNPNGEELSAKVAQVVEYVKREILPHAQAEEVTIYQQAHREAAWKVLVDSMIYEHEVLKALFDQLQDARSGTESFLIAENLDGLFRLHAEKENRFIIRHMAARTDIDLAKILQSMQSVLEQIA